MSEFCVVEASIRQLHARYVDAVWRKDTVAFGTCFSEHAEWRMSGEIYRGRDEIVETITRIFSNTNHILMSTSTPILDLEHGTVSSRTYITEQCAWKNGEANMTIGSYYDRYVVAGEGWIFIWRLFQLHYSGPPDLSGHFVEQPDFGPPPAMPDLNAVPQRHASLRG